MVILFVFWILPVLHIRGENLGTIFGICTPGLAKVDRGEGWIRMIIMLLLKISSRSKSILRLTSLRMRMKFIVEERDDCYHQFKLMTKMISNIINEMLNSSE